MAIWQIEFYVISENMHENDIDVTLWHEDITLKALDICFLDKKKGWCETIIQYGDSDGNCIELVTNENHKVEEISVRLDIRNLDNDMMENIIEYVNSLSGKIFYEDKIYIAKKDILLSIIYESSAFKFCREPMAFISNLDRMQ